MAGAHSTSEIAVADRSIKVMRGGTGEPLVLLAGASGASWLPFMDKLAQSYEVIAPEHPGFGGSERPDWLDTIHDLAYFYLDVLAALKLERVHLVGHGLGGWIAAELAVRSTARLASLTLAGAAGLHVAGVSQVDPFLGSEEERLRASFFEAKVAEEILAQPKRPEDEDIALQNRATLARLTWQPRNHDPHLAKWLHRIDVPTLLIWGDHDRLFPQEVARAYQRAIPGAKLLIVPDCGHLSYIEKPDAFVAALEGLPGARKAA